MIYAACNYCDFVIESCHKLGEPVLRRKYYSKILDWKRDYAPGYALFIKGARRVGKTTIAEEFGAREYRSFITVNFQEANDTIRDLFVNSLLDLDYFFNVLQMQYKIRLFPRESLIILDEIQLFPKARQALKTLLKDGRYDYIETGSLAGITKKSKQEEILIPSEEHAVEMFPLDFEEFLWAMGDEITPDIIRDHYAKLRPLNKLHRDILRKFREYMCVGGMPQAVVEYAVSKDFERVDFAKREILALYRNDIKEQDEENSVYVDSILDHLPSELSRHDASANTFRLTHLDKNARMREYRGAFRWLSEAMIVNIARNITDPSPALTLTLDDDRFKCYMMDTGLLINLSFGDGAFMDNDFYRAILTDRLHINEGMFVENIIAQCLRTNGHKPIFYVEYDKYGKMILEVDFLVRMDRKVVPIEAKSGKEYTVKSLLKFKEKFSDKVGKQIVLHDGDLKKEGDLIFIPYYMSFVI